MNHQIMLNITVLSLQISPVSPFRESNFYQLNFAPRKIDWWNCHCQTTAKCFFCLNPTLNSTDYELTMEQWDHWTPFRHLSNSTLIKLVREKPYHKSQTNLLTDQKLKFCSNTIPSVIQMKKTNWINFRTSPM